jgi:2-iminobutanoate/2-iminopropanoate deaminase
LAAVTPHDPEGVFAPVGPYTHALEVAAPSRWLFTSGTMGLDPDGRAPEGIEAQLEMAWRNLGLALRSAGMTETNIVKVTTYLADRADRPAATARRAAVLGDHRPAVTTIVAGLLEDGWLVEIEIVAAA